ncbi:MULTISPECIES: prolyl oligopeptidase family serine peptidase [unclassified Dysgonomonas]|uniref:alpha/beta hydrolase family protein n=1 Tax=unclassified Dysgonomonas TaxID=2630389 RepID=UPI0025B9BF93|nr:MULTISPECIES: prolyl oligopeptidase family serine peptidase [unclassified Dysgonomonas]MDR2001505.1 prolyl oligopeptidase family serine peptidase [Prevotella sp.]HMM03078.1 prolyl oligopeptidase family serine peptidase [Dysgonomonas sp.]
MKLRLSVIALCLILVIGMFSQTKQKLPQIYAAPPVAVINPLIVDSTNLKGDKYSEKELLKMSMTIPEQTAFVRPLKSDTAGYFYAEKPREGYTFQLFSFYVQADRYAKLSLKITSPNMFELYVDGKLSTSKTTREENFRNEKEVTAAFNPYPLSSRVVIKLLASAEDKSSPIFKIVLENEKDDDKTTFSVQNTSKRFVNFTDMLLGKRVTNTSISPNGQYALISYRNTFGEKSVSTTELYNVSTGRQVLLDTDGSKKQLSWMPVSEKMFYLLKTEDGTNLITIDPATLQETILAKNIPDEYMTFSPDEKTLFYTKQEKGEETKGDLKLLLSPEDRQPGYTNRSFIYKYDIRSGLSQQLTYGSHTTWLNDISADSKQLLISFTDETVTERPFRKYTMLKLDLPTMTVDTLWTNEGFAHGASFSPDGKKVLISGSGEAFGGIGQNIDAGQIANSYNGLAFIMDLSTKQIDPITKNFDPSIDNSFWNKKDNLIYFRTTDKDYVNMYAYNPSGKSFAKLPLNEEVIRSFSTADNAMSAIYFGVSQSNSTRAYLYDIKNQKSTMVADPYNDRLSEMTLGKAEDWNFTNSAGTEIKGSCYLPPNFDASKKYPMIVYYYGGTSPTSRTFEGPYPAHVFAAQGYVVYIIQPSGATGFGQKFAALHVNAWGKRTAEDIIEGVKQFVKEHPYVNDKKIGCVGASYGGFMTMYLQTRTDIFAAAVSHAGISSISSYWGEGYWGYTYSSGASAHSYPWNNPDLYVKQSPLFSADKVHTPILFTHGTVDTNVPIGESIQMYTALKILGRPAEFIQVKDENHGVMNYKRRVEWNNSIMAWFAKWLKDDNGWWKGLYPDAK